MPSSLKTLNQYANIIVGEPEELKLKRLNEENKKHIHKSHDHHQKENNLDFIFEEKKENNNDENFRDSKEEIENFKKEEEKFETTIDNLNDEIKKEEVIIEEVKKEEIKVVKPTSTNLTRKKKS